MKQGLPGLILFFLISFFLFFGFKSVPQVSSEEANHIVISEIQTRGSGGANDEFVELYNPTGVDVDITGWSLKRLATTIGASETNIVSSMSGTIKSNGFFLLVRTPGETGYTGAVVPDSTFGSALADNTTILLYDSSDTQKLIDKVGMGEGSSPEGSYAPTHPGLSENVSIERKACAGSTSSTMQNGDSENGNAWDSDNNAEDFVVRAVSNPQNSQSAVEVPECFGINPTDTPAPTNIPTATPTDEPIEAPTLTPTSILTLTPTTTPVATSTPIPTVKPDKPVIIIPTYTISCTVDYKVMNFKYFSFEFPKIKCSLVKV